MNNFINYIDIDKINSQLDRAEIQKRILTRKIYREYELYLNLVRDLLFISVEKGLNQIYSYPTINDNFLNENEFYSLFEKKISKLLFTNLPFLTVEQLKINEIEKNINKEINFTIFDSSTKIKDNQKEKFQIEDGFQLNEPTQFKITEDFSNTSEYYQAHNYERFVSLNLDNNQHNNYLAKNNIFENLEVEKQFISSLLELIGEEKVEKPINQEKENINQMDNLPNNQILNNFDLIDKSFENLLLDLKIPKTILFRMTGCPNGCTRPYMAELALVGSGQNKYQLWLGGSKNLQRLAKPFLQRMELNDLEKTLQPLFDNWKSNLDLDFGDFINTQDENYILNLLNENQ